ncbi:hypothetical protein FACS189434_07430 [Bacteroidia bacterium]|nr:hypothetical protein FACS189434_07430 [Bacteroidia bacterium]
MTKEEIRDIAIDSAQSYYDYLEQNDKGVQEVDVFEIEYLTGRDIIIKLRLSSKLFDTEAIFFKNLRNNKKYDTAEIKVIEYDNDKNILLIKPNEKNKETFLQLKNTDLKVISDLKFLVQRVKTWYELNGAQVSLPNKISKYANDIDKIEFFKESNFQPSENQKESLKNIFTNPFSYVWGAPGTGKTQFVLSYAVLHYIKKGDKVAILAPTNNAIEQVLRGVIKMTDKAGINRKQILRLGTPSKKFAEAFPEVCEEKGVQKNIAEIDKQINILERMLAYQKKHNFVEHIQTILSKFDNIDEFAKQTLTKQNEIDKVNVDYKKNEIEIKLFNDEILQQNKVLAKTISKAHSIFHKLTKTFSTKSTTTENLIENTENKIFQLKKDLEFSKYKLEEIGKKQKNIVIEREEILLSSNKFIGDFKNQFSDYEELKNIANDLSIKNYKEIKDQIESVVETAKKQLEIDQHIFSEYKNTSLINIEDNLNNYLQIRKKIADSSTEERLKSVNVIACTLDGYIGRYAEAKMNVAHIFLDEAGYANIEKVLTLFNHDVPISFLGDHMQLPPVCEINDMDIEKDSKYYNMFLWAQSAIFLDTLFAFDKNTCKNNYLRNQNFNPNKIIKTSLNSTFRFGDNLANILAKYVYADDFNSANHEGETQILFIDAKKTEVLKSRISNNEVLAIRELVNKLKVAGNNDFIILTPYKKQVKLLNTYLPQERNDLKILTVHGSQGREWNTVILSVVDTADKWFVDTTIPISKGLNLVNTAVSRAKKNLIIVCDTNYWFNQNGQLITELLKSGKNINI